MIYGLTGSANILLLPKLSESLAGRMHVLRLYPLSQCEIINTKPLFIEWMLETDAKLTKHRVTDTEYEKIVCRGGFPEILNMEELSQNDWFQSYISTLLLRDVRDLAQIEQINLLPNLLQILAQRIGSTLNQSDISRMTGLQNVTQKRYLNLLEALYLTETIKPLFTNLDKRLVKSPKLYLGDTGVASYMLNQNFERLKTNRILFGQILKNWVITELQRIISFSDNRLNIFHFRTSDQYEIDIILEDPNGDLYPTEVKSSATIKSEFWSGIDVLIDQTKNRVRKAIIFYTGTQIIQVSAIKFILPISLLWNEEVYDFI